MTTYLPHITLPIGVFTNPAASVLLPVVLGTTVGYSTRPDKTQRTYVALKQPPLAPPPWVFGPVWTLLYGLMGYAAHRAVSLATSPTTLPAARDQALAGATLYTLQLGVNLAWMPLFFGLRKPVAALVDIVALLGMNVYLATSLWGPLDPVAGWCLAPYCAWISFATYLCAGVGYLNNWNFDEETKSAAEGKKNA